MKPLGSELERLLGVLDPVGEAVSVLGVIIGNVRPQTRGSRLLAPI